jgi:phage protein D/phage baseplate assembly protein gpV
MPQLPRPDQAIRVPDFSISAHGRPLPALASARVTRVSLTRRIDPPDNFSIELYDPELALATPPLGPFAEGAEITVQVGFRDGARIGLSGTVTAVTAEFGPDGEPVVRVDGFDALHALTRGTGYRVFAGQGGAGMPDGQVAGQLATDAGLVGQADAGLTRAAAPVQDHVNDLTFLRELAAVNGYSIWVERGTLQFRRQRVAPAGVDLRRGDDLLSLRLRLSTTGQAAGVTVRGWDAVQKQPCLGRAARAGLGPELSPVPAGGSGRELVIAHAGVASVAEAQALAEAIMADQGQSLVVGSGVAIGRPELDVGAVVSLHGAGRFDRGRYVVTEATHTIDDSGYRTDFRLNGAGRADPFAGPGGSGAAGGDGARGVSGVTVGLVTDNKDPANQGRVKVRRATAPDGEIWARLAAPMAGRDRGAHFVPEVGDEVVLAFEQGHPARPYVIGGLWNGRDTPPGTSPDVRVLKSRSGHTVTLDDTDGAERVEIAEKSGRSRVVLDSAAGTVTVHGGGDVTVEAPDGLLRLRGNRVEITADAGIAVRADGTLDLAGKGPATLKGATVDIN